VFVFERNVGKFVFKRGYSISVAVSEFYRASRGLNVCNSGRGFIIVFIVVFSDFVEFINKLALLQGVLRPVEFIVRALQVLASFCCIIQFIDVLRGFCLVCFVILNITEALKLLSLVLNCLVHFIKTLVLIFEINVFFLI